MVSSTVGLTVGSTFGSTVGSMVGSMVGVLGYQPQQSVQQLGREAKQTHCFTDLFYRLR